MADERVQDIEQAVVPEQQSEPQPDEAPQVSGDAQSDARESEIRKLQHKIRELEAENRKYREATMSEAERLRQRLAEYERLEAEWQRERQEFLMRTAVDATARKLGFADPELAWRLLDLVEVEFDDEGRPRNVEALLRKLAQRWPYLLSSGVSPANAGRQPSTFTRSQLRDPEFFRKHRDAILQAHREGRITE
jgi:hypothetical protein